MQNHEAILVFRIELLDLIHLALVYFNLLQASFEHKIYLNNQTVTLSIAWWFREPIFSLQIPKDVRYLKFVFGSIGNRINVRASHSYTRISL